MILNFISGELELAPHHACLPDVAQMVDDIERAHRAMHQGRVVVVYPEIDGGRFGNIHTFVGGFFSRET